MTTAHNKPDKFKVTDLYQACAIAEGFDGEEHTQEEILAAWSFIVKSGATRSLQGWYGRTAQSLIDNGFLDGYGNILNQTIIP